MPAAVRRLYELLYSTSPSKYESQRLHDTLVHSTTNAVLLRAPFAHLNLLPRSPYGRIIAKCTKSHLFALHSACSKTHESFT
eukprot:2751686-Pleurochrysis_carterae.AAC.4